MDNLINIDIGAIIEQIASRVSAQLKNDFGRGWPKLMSITTAAKYIDRTERAVHELIRDNVIPTTKIDGRTQVDRDVLDRLIERHTQFNDIRNRRKSA